MLFQDIIHAIFALELQQHSKNNPMEGSLTFLTYTYCDWLLAIQFNILLLTAELSS